MQSLSRNLRTWCQDHTTTRLPLGATTLRPSFQAARAFHSNPIEYLRARAAEGDVVRLHLGFTEFHLVTDPSLVKRILVSDDALFGEGKWTQRGRFVMGDCLITREGEPHRERRTLLRAHFHDFDADRHTADMLDAVDRYTEAWSDGDAIELRTEMGRIALGIASRFLFQEDPQTRAPTVLEDLFRALGAIARVPIPDRALRASLDRLHALARTMRRGPLLEGLREAGVAEVDIDREIISLMIASVDTTPGTLSWTWTLLAQHPKAEASVHDELCDVLGTSAATLAQLPKLAALEEVIAEVLRLQPPVRFIDRRVLADMNLGSSAMRAGDYILLSPLLSHHDDRFWDAPDEFRPARWRANGDERIDRSAYFPFGAGPHACIGGALAQREIKMIVATLARRWRFRPIGTPPDTELPARRFDVRLEKRT